MTLNLSVLPAETMLAHSRRWLADEDLCTRLERHALGRTALEEVRQGHEFLAETLATWHSLTAMVSSLSDAILLEDDEHDRFARALYRFLGALAESAESSEEAEQYLQARALLFPWGLGIIHRPYAEEHSVVLEIERRMTPVVHALLAETPVGKRTLLDIYDNWIVAGKRLGAQVRERERLEVSMLLHAGADALPRLDDGRNAWKRAVRVFLGMLDIVPLAPGMREAIITPLARDIDDCIRLQERGA